MLGFPSDCACQAFFCLTDGLDGLCVPHFDSNLLPGL